MTRDDQMVHREASGALALSSRRQMDANGVRRVDHTDVTYGFGTPAKSIFHGANDAAYDDSCTEEEYYHRVGQGVNALSYLPGLGEDGRSPPDTPQSADCIAFLATTKLARRFERKWS